MSKTFVVKNYGCSSNVSIYSTYRARHVANLLIQTVKEQKAISVLLDFPKERPFEPGSVTLSLEETGEFIGGITMILLPDDVGIITIADTSKDKILIQAAKSEAILEKWVEI